MIGLRRAALMVVLTPAAVGSLVLIAAVSGRRNRGGKLSRLRKAILGREKEKIAAMLGPPRVMQADEENTWYYPLEDDRLAMAISFDRGFARQVEFLQSPVEQLR